MNKQEFINKIEELRENGECDLRTVIYFANQLDETKSLDQHDLEIRADERKKVCEELLEWLENNKKYMFVGDCGCKDFMIYEEDLKEKLTELKGE